jgi:hypothetical protein
MEKTLFPGSKGGIIIVFVPNSFTDDGHTIKKMVFLLQQYPRLNERVQDGFVRARLYERNLETHEPGRSLISDDLIVKVKGTRKPTQIEIDLSKFYIDFPKTGVFVGLEWLGEDGINKEININPGFCYSKDTVGCEQWISFYGRKFTRTDNKQDSMTPLFGIITN